MTRRHKLGVLAMLVGIAIVSFSWGFSVAADLASDNLDQLAGATRELAKQLALCPANTSRQVNLFSAPSFLRSSRGRSAVFPAIRRRTAAFLEGDIQ